MKNAIFVLLILSMFFATQSCRTIKNTSSSISVDSASSQVTKTSIIQDSVFVHFSDTVKIVQKGDTIYQDVVRWRTRDVIKIVNDTLIVRDTVIKYEFRDVQKTEVKKDWHFMLLSIYLFVVSIIIVVIILLKPRKI